MDLRDYFAARAMQGLCAYTGSLSLANVPDEIARRAWQIADAMLVARLKPVSPSVSQ